MDKNKNWLVYEHTSPSGRIYIGITNQSPNRRWKNGLGYYHNIPFYAAIKKYGWNNIKHRVLVQDLTKEEAKELEKLFISKNKGNGISYNITDGGEGANGVVRTLEQRKLISKGLKKYYSEHTSPIKGTKWSLEHRKKVLEARKNSWTEERLKKHSEIRCKSCVVYNILTGEEQEFASKKDMAKALKINSSSLREYIAKTQCINSCVFWYKGEKSKEEVLSTFCYGKGHGGVVQLDLSNNFVAFHINTIEAAKAVGADCSCIRRGCLGANKTSCGYKWMYLDEYMEKLKRH